MRNLLFVSCFIVSLSAYGQDRYQAPTSRDASNAAISQFIASQPAGSSTTVVPMGDTGISTIYAPSGNYTAITNPLNVTTITGNDGQRTICITSPFGVTSCR